MLGSQGQCMRHYWNYHDAQSKDTWPSRAMHAFLCDARSLLNWALSWGVNNYWLCGYVISWSQVQWRLCSIHGSKSTICFDSKSAIAIGANYNDAKTQDTSCNVISMWGENIRVIRFKLRWLGTEFQIAGIGMLDLDTNSKWKQSWWKLRTRAFHLWSKRGDKVTQCCDIK